VIEKMNFSELPKGWTNANLGYVADYINGRAFKPSEWEQHGRPILRIQNLTKSSNVVNRYSKPIEEKYIIQDGQLLISWSATLDAYIYRGEEAVLNQHIFKVEPFIDKMFLYHLIKAHINNLKSKIHGSGMQHITKNKFEELIIPLPPLNEQKRIVTKIEELFTKLEASVEDLKSVKKKLDVYRMSFLNEIYSTKKTKKVVLQEITEKIQDGSHFSPKKQYLEKKPNTFLYITAKNIRNNGMNLKKIKYVEKEFFDSIYPRCNPQIGDVLLTKDGVNTGMCCINTLNEPFALLSSVAIIRGKENILNNKYLLYYLKSPEGFYGITGKMTGTAIKRIILKRIKEAKIPLVPFKEQEQIVQEIESRFSVIDKLEETVDNNIKKQEQLRKSILKNAFEGKLAPQDPSDEPAEFLLKRIKNENQKYEQMRLT